MRRVLFFIHIPKTAGSAFRQMLWRNVRSRLIEVPHVFFEGPIEKGKIRIWLNQDTAKLAVASHHLSLDLPLEDCETFSGFAVAVIRDPIDWLASHFYYTRKPGIVSFSTADQFGSIDDYVQHLSSQMHDPHFRPPSQARSLLSSASIQSDNVQTPLQKRRLFLLPQEHLLEGVTVLAMRFPELLRDPSIEQLNVNVRPRVLLSPETRRMARELLADDFRLHLLAQDNLKELVSELDQGAFQRKLRAVRIKSRLRAIFLSKLQSVSERANRLVQSL
jgi:hypothetical protein